MTSPNFGPWRAGLDPAERRARCRSLRAVAGILAGPRADALVDALREAETDPAALDRAADTLDALEPLDRRRILASYGSRALPHPAFVNPLGKRRPEIFVSPAWCLQVRPVAGIVGHSRCAA